MSCEIFEKDVLDTRIVTLNFSSWLGSGVEISSVSWTVPSDLTAANESNTTTTASNYFSGGTDLDEYLIKCSITTNEAVPRTKTVQFTLRIRSDCQ